MPWTLTRHLRFTARALACPRLRTTKETPRLEVPDGYSPLRAVDPVLRWSAISRRSHATTELRETQCDLALFGCIESCTEDRLVDPTRERFPTGCTPCASQEPRCGNGYPIRGTSEQSAHPHRLPTLAEMIVSTRLACRCLAPHLQEVQVHHFLLMPRVRAAYRRGQPRQVWGLGFEQ